MIFIMAMLSFKDTEAATTDVLLIIYMLLNNKITSSTSAEENRRRDNGRLMIMIKWIDDLFVSPIYVTMYKFLQEYLKDITWR